MNQPTLQPTPHDPDATATAHGTRATASRPQRDRLLEEAERVLRAGWDAAARLVRQGNRRRATLTSREGEVWVRMPLTLAVLVTVLLLPAWPLLVVLVAVGFAVGAQLSVERLADEPGAAEAPNRPS
ncbi:MAG: DUF4342 domain-containing protein [Nocardiopsis sp. BM-2018]|nr:MAG: DUF4342 domain-containing protein [Nocardiopsis sp. BM-2018]